ncbi:MAG: hypothetical protein KDE14_01530 [Rhodobacteraceae bacterium]|nr:hypothetical protein [Paracoccaceae bacterium]
MIRHKKTTPKADGDDAGRVQPSDWNDEHVISGMLGALDKLATVPGVPYLKEDGSAGVAELTAAGLALLKVASYAALLEALGAAPLDSPNFLNAPRAVTPLLTDNSTRLATTEFVQAIVAAVVSSSPATLDTLQELAAALGDDPNFATTIATALGNRLRVDAAQGLLPTQRAFAIANLAIEYADLIGKPTLGTAAALDVGTSAGQVVQLDGAGRLPAVDGTQVTGIQLEGAVRFDQAQTLSPVQQQTAAVNMGVVGAVRRRTFTASGTYEPDANLLFADIECVGGGGGGISSSASGGPGAGAVAGTGDLAMPGSPGYPGFWSTAAGSLALGGGGASSVFGGGALARNAAGSTQPGYAADGYGAGGGGASSNSSSSNASAIGGGGKAGIVIITEYCSQ